MVKKRVMEREELVQFAVTLNILLLKRYVLHVYSTGQKLCYSEMAFVWFGWFLNVLVNNSLTHSQSLDLES